VDGEGGFDAIMKNGLTTVRMRQIWGGLFGIGLAAEVVAVVRPQAGDTLSELVDDTSKGFPIMAAAVGAVAGHWYGKRDFLVPFVGGFVLGAIFWPLKARGSK
jgi:hypothetical protein